LRVDLPPLDQLLVEGAFTADDMTDLVTVRADKRDRLGDHEGDREEVVLRGAAEIDYALARFVAANCAVAGDSTGTPTPFVLKGGLEIHTCFGGARRSKDADLSPSGPGAEIEGLLPPRLITAPIGMRILEPTQTTEDGWRVPIEFTTTVGGDVATVICDLNNDRRPVRRRPAIARPFVTPFTTIPPTVWVVRPEEMIGEKISAVLRRRNGRLRDIFDIDHLLSRSVELDLDVKVIREVAIEAISELVAHDNLRLEVRELIEKRTLSEGDVLWVRAEIRRIGSNARPKDWKAQVADVVPGAASAADVTNSLMAHWEALNLLDPVA
jgi:hypothetical protein